MPETEWILNRYTFVKAGNILVRGLRVRVTLKDYRCEEGDQNAGTIVAKVVHVLVEDLDPDNHNPGSLTFLLPKGKRRVFVLSERQGLFVLSDLALDGSPLVSMRGWTERIAIRDHLEGLGFRVNEEGRLMKEYGTQGLEWAESYFEQACENHGTSLTLRSDLVRGPRGYDQAPGLAWRVSGGGSAPQQEALVSLASAISPALGGACSGAVEESKARSEEVKKEHQGVLVRVKEGKLLSLESTPGPTSRSN